MPDLEASKTPPVAFPGALSRSLSVGFVGTDKERWSFHFFQQETAPELSGFFGGRFWQGILLQAALHEPSIKHAILALGFLHAKLARDDSLTTPQSHTEWWSNDFALMNYNQAIKILVGTLSPEVQRTIDVYLICSILFACLEVSCFSPHALLRAYFQ